VATLDLIVNVVTKGARDLDTLSGKLRGIGTGLTIGVTAPILGIGAAALTAAQDAEKAQTKVESVFDSMGAAAWTTVDALNAQAEALMGATTFDDESIKDAQARLLTFSEVTGESFDRALDHSADLAAFFETDMDTAAQTLGKALQNPVDGLAKLGRQGIIFSDEQKEMVAALMESGDIAGAQAVILDEVAAQVGTVAEDLAATSGGQMAQAMNRLGEAGEAIGTFLLPVLATLADWLSKAAGWFSGLDEGTQGFIVAIGAIVAVVGPAVLAISSIVGAFGAVGGAFKTLSVLLLTNPFVALIAAAAALVAVIVLNWDQISKVISDALKWISDRIRAFGDFVGQVWDTITGTIEDAAWAVLRIGRTIWQPIATGFGAAIDAVKGIWNAFVGFWNGIQISVPAVDVPLVGTVGGFTIGLPDLPRLAEGGIVTQPTLAIIGEKGPEAVVPLGQGIGEYHTHIHLEFTGEPPEDDTELLDILRQAAPFIDGRLRLADG
jgi:hypothetical protein